MLRLGASLADEIKSQLLCQLSYAPSTTYGPYYQTVT
jgi:hypothetical protein